MQVFVPSYSGNRMVMLKINDMNDFESLPITKWNIRQPNHDGIREDATETGKTYYDGNDFITKNHNLIGIRFGFCIKFIFD